MGFSHRTYLLLIILICLPAVQAELRITEIMYDPPGDDSYLEWIELFNTGPDIQSLENVTICNVSVQMGYLPKTNTTTALSNTTWLLEPGEFAIITDGGTGTDVYEQFANAGTAFHVTTSSICGGLVNNNDTILLSTPSISSVFYDSALGAAGNNRTLCRFPEANQTFRECLPSPGFENRIPAQMTITPQSTATQNTPLFLLNITMNTCEPAEVSVTYNITGPSTNASQQENTTVVCSAVFAQFTPTISGSYQLCWNASAPLDSQAACGTLSVNETAPPPDPGPPAILPACPNITIAAPILVNASTSMSYQLILTNPDCVEQQVNITYGITDLFGIPIRDPATTIQNVTCTKSVSRSWTPPETTGSEAYEIHAHIDNTTCVGQAPNASTIIIVRGNAGRETSELIIRSADTTAQFGSILNLEFEVYRAGTAKYAVSAWTEINGQKSSAISTMHATQQNTNYTLQLPLAIKQNCDSAIPSGTHQLVVAGLDQEVRIPVAINGIATACQTIVTTSSTSSGGGGGSSSSPTSNALPPRAENTIRVEIQSANETAPAGAEIMLKVQIENLYASVKNVTLYSYIFRGSDLASEGGWTPNSITLSLNASRNLTILLRNTVKSDVPEGLYYWRVRARTDKNFDKTSELMITPPPTVPQEQPIQAQPRETQDSKESDSPEQKTTDPTNSPPLNNLVTGQTTTASIPPAKILNTVINFPWSGLLQRFVTIWNHEKP